MSSSAQTSCVSCLQQAQAIHGSLDQICLCFYLPLIPIAVQFPGHSPLEIAQIQPLIHITLAALPVVTGCQCSLYLLSFSNSTAPPASLPVNSSAFCFIPGIASNSFLQARFINQLLQSCLPPPGTLCMSFVNDSSQPGLIAVVPLLLRHQVLC